MNDLQFKERVCVPLCAHACVTETEADTGKAKGRDRYAPSDAPGCQIHTELYSARKDAFQSG